MRWKEFQADLDSLVLEGGVAAEVLPADLEELSLCFADLRTRSATKLSELVNRLKAQDPDNPAFLPFGLFGLLHGTGLRETAHTRMLAWLFDPRMAKLEHGLPRDVFMPILEFVSSDKSWPRDGAIYSVTKVTAEKFTAAGKRIDIWVEGKLVTPDGDINEWLVVFEAKLDAPLRDQLRFYVDEGKLWQALSPRRLEPCYVYLKDGTAPDEYWTELSFLKIYELIWPKIKNQSAAPGYHMARYYLAGILADIEGWAIPIRVSAHHLDYEMIQFCSTLLKRTERFENE